jgi:predicted O-methyltransferase YrrM
MARLVAMFIRATGAQRVLLIGSGDQAAFATILDSLPERGLLLTIEGDRTKAASARQLIAARTPGRQISVIAAEASRYLHKLAGPFDVVVQDSAPAGGPALHDRLVRLLAASGTLITQNVNAAAEYNRVLIADERLTTMTMNIGSGVAVSVKHRNSSQTAKTTHTT